MGESENHSLVRLLIFEWLDQQLAGKPWLSWEELVRGFDGPFGRIPLITMRGIWNPRQLEHTLSITSTLNGPYADTWLSQETFEYSYQGQSGLAGDNTKLRLAMQDRIPMIYLQQISVGKYLPIYPVYVIGDNTEKRTFTVSVESTADFTPVESLFSENIRDYKEQITRRRLHQPRFRAEVILAYSTACAICRLKHVELLDAAHIVPDSEPNGLARVPNGMALCKIHHAAYDSNVMGISPDFQVQVRRDIMLETDGPMLKNGIQAMHGTLISTPKLTQLKPDKDALAWRFERFLKADAIS
jgi:putative restriction endonuclease